MNKIWFSMSRDKLIENLVSTIKNQDKIIATQEECIKTSDKIIDKLHERIANYEKFAAGVKKIAKGENNEEKMEQG